MATIDEVRLDAIEKRMDKYDELMSVLRDAVVQLKAHAEANSKWHAAIIAVSSAIAGGLVGHFIH